MKARQDMRCTRCGDNDAKFRIDGEDLCWICFKKQDLKDQRDWEDDTNESEDDEE